jgi:CubicO group peptidase (beta-lactamase class C family)
MNITTFFGTICMSMLILPATTEAQKQHYFTVDGQQKDIVTFDAEITKMMDDVGIPAMSLAVIDDNKVVYYKAYGYKDAKKKEKVDTKTLFEAASLSKSYLVYVAFKLVDAGLLDLDKPMYQYLKYEPLEHDPRYKSITPRMILSHSSGIENWLSDNIVDTLEILSDPGTKFIYSGEGYDYLAKVISLLLHESYAQYEKEMVIGPLKLMNSYVEFKKTKHDPYHKILPWDYVVGHDFSGNELTKFINFEPVPACQNNVTAEDYAKLIIAIFDHKHLSAGSIRTILTPQIPTRINDDNTAYYYGTGFEIIYSGNDTIIAHGGSNAGFKNLLFYSPIHKRGFVFMTNSDRGKMMGANMSALTAKLDIAKCLNDFGEQQYPNTAISLLSVYEDKGSAEMFAEIGRLKNKGQLQEQTLNNLAVDFMDIDQAIAKRLLQQNMTLYPQSAWLYRILGRLYMGAGQYDSAYTFFLRSKQLKFDSGDINDDLQSCRAKINEVRIRSSRLITVAENSKDTIRAENYNSVSGDWLTPTQDGGGPRCVVADSGKWMEYKVDFPSPGIYKVNFRVSSNKNNNNELQLFSGDSLLKTISIPFTGSWEKYATVSAFVQFPAGVQQLKLNVDAGMFLFHWMQFLRSPGDAKKSAIERNSLQQ